LLRANGFHQLLAQHLNPDRHLCDRALGLNILVASPDRSRLATPRSYLLGAFTSAYISKQSADPGVLCHSARGVITALWD